MRSRRIPSRPISLFEYTILAIVSVVLTIVLDGVLGTRLLRRGEFWLFMGIMTFFKVLANGYLTARPIVLYGEEFNVGVRLSTIPVEDFLYGFSLITATVILWEYFRGKETQAGPHREVGGDSQD